MTITDIIILISSIFLLWQGWRKGIVQMLIGPIAFFGGLAISYFVFLKTNNLVLSLVISLIAPIILRIFFFLFFKFGGKDKKSDDVFILSRILGALFEWAWGIVFVLILVVFLAALPYNFFNLGKIQNDILRSTIYTYISRYIPVSQKPQTNKISETLSVLKDPQKSQKLQSTPEFEAIAEDQMIQSILQDKDVMEAAQKNDIMTLINNPKFRQLLQNPQAIKKFMDFQMRILKEANEKLEKNY